MAEQRAEVAAIAARPGAAARSTTPSSRSNGRAPCCGVSRRSSRARRVLSTPGDPRDRGAGGAAARRARRRDLPGPGAVRPAGRAARRPPRTRSGRRVAAAAGTRHRDAVRAGARLGPAAQERLRALNAELSALVHGVRHPPARRHERRALVVDDPGRLDGLSPDAVAAAARAAEARGHPGRYGCSPRCCRPPSPPWPRCTTGRSGSGCTPPPSRAARGAPTRHHATSSGGSPRCGPSGRGCSGTRTTRPTRSPTTPPAASRRSRRCSAKLVPAAVANARIEAEDLQEARRRVHPSSRGTARIYTEQIRRERAIDATALRPYLELERVLHDGVFAAAGELYGLRFDERHDLPVYHPDVRVFHVDDRDGEPVGLFVADHYTRETKRGGAWMNSFVVQSRLLGTRPVVLNTLNLTKPPPASRRCSPSPRSSRSSTSSATPCTGCCRTCGTRRSRAPAYPRLRRVPVAGQRGVAARPGGRRPLRPPPRHRCTAAHDLRARLIDPAPAFGEGFATTEYLAAALLDLAWHRLAPGEAVDDVEAFEAAALAAAGVAVAACPRATAAPTSTTSSPAAYSAAYYSYIWSEVLDADTVEWFGEHGGLRRQNGEVFAEALLSPRRQRSTRWRPIAPSAAVIPRSPRSGPPRPRRSTGLMGRVQESCLPPPVAAGPRAPRTPRRTGDQQCPRRHQVNVNAAFPATGSADRGKVACGGEARHRQADDLARPVTGGDSGSAPNGAQPSPGAAVEAASDPGRARPGSASASTRRCSPASGCAARAPPRRSRTPGTTASSPDAACRSSAPTARSPASTTGNARRSRPAPSPHRPGPAATRSPVTVGTPIGAPTQHRPARWGAPGGAGGKVVRSTRRSASSRPGAPRARGSRPSGTSRAG